MTVTAPDAEEPTGDALPLAQSLILEVLAARHRTGEQMWSFERRCTRQLRALEGAGLVGWRSGPEPESVQAWLTKSGRDEVLLAGYRPPNPLGNDRVAAYLDRAADSAERTGLIGDVVRAGAWREAAAWCRDHTMWGDAEEEP